MNESSRMELAVKYFTNHRWIFSGIGVLIGIIAIFYPQGILIFTLVRFHILNMKNYFYLDLQNISVQTLSS